MAQSEESGRPLSQLLQAAPVEFDFGSGVEIVDDRRKTIQVLEKEKDDIIRETQIGTFRASIQLVDGDSDEEAYNANRMVKITTRSEGSSCDKLKRSFAPDSSVDLGQPQFQAA